MDKCIYLSNYLLYFFKDVPEVPRDYKTEYQIERASKIEYLLRHSLNPQSNLPSILKINGYTPKGQKYEIRFTKNRVFDNVYYDGKPDESNYSILEEFGIDTTSIVTRTSLLNLYCLTRRIEIEEAVEVIPIAEFLDSVNVPTLKDKASLENPDCRMHVKADGELLYTYHNKSHRDSIHILEKGLESDKKVMIPCFCYGKCRPENHFCFMPQDEHVQPLFNSGYMELYPKATVIICDSIKLCATNQKILSNANVHDIVWVAWHSDNSTISPEVDWSMLKNKKVLFLLKERMDMSRTQVYDRAKSIEVTLKGIVKEFKYASMLTNMADSDMSLRNDAVGIPGIFTSEELDAIRSNASMHPQAPISACAFSQKRVQLATASKLLMSPIIKDQSLTLVHGDEHDVLCWFTLNLAFSISQGQKALEGWSAKGQAIPVLYLHRDHNGSTDFHNKLLTMFNLYAGRLKVSRKDYKPSTTLDSDGPFPFPFRRTCKNPKYPGAINDTFYWNIFDQHTTYDMIDILQGFRDSFVLQQIQFMEDKFPNQSKLLILDGLWAHDPLALVRVNALIDKLSERGWTFIIVDSNEKDQPGSEKFKVPNIYTDKMLIDNTVRVNRCSRSDLSKLSMHVKFKTSYKLAKYADKSFKCALSLNTSPPTFMKFKSTKWSESYMISRQELKEKVKKRYLKGDMGQAIADELQVSLSLVKKLRVEIKKEEQIVYGDPKSKKK